MGRFARLQSLLAAARKPLLIAGHGVRLARCAEQFRRWLEEKDFVCALTWGGADLLPTAHPWNLGVIGVSGQRGANMACFEADFILALGTHLGPTQIGQDWAPQAKKGIVDIDFDQLARLGFRADEAVCADLREFFPEAMGWEKAPIWPIDHLKVANAKTIPDQRFTSYKFNHRLTYMLPPGTVMVVDGGGTTLYTGFQSSIVKEGSRLVCAGAISAMGSGIPEAIGACLANGRRLTTCLIGDGSFMLNVQELQTLRHHNLPVKVFVINNGGYLAIRQTQRQHLAGRYFGTSPVDCSLPDIQKVAQGFGCAYFRIDGEAEANATLPVVLAQPGPAVVEVLTPQDQEIVGPLAGKPLSQMHPLLEAA